MVEVYSRRSTEHVVVLVPELSSKQQLSNAVTDWVTENATIRIDYSYLRSYLNASREMVLLATRPESSSSLVKCVSNWSDLYIRLSCPSISQSIINTSPLILSLSPHEFFHFLATHASSLLQILVTYNLCKCSGQQQPHTQLTTRCGL